MADDSVENGETRLARDEDDGTGETFQWAADDDMTNYSHTSLIQQRLRISTTAAQHTQKLKCLF